MFMDLFQPLVCSFEEMKDSTHETRTLRTRFPFIISVVVTKEVLWALTAFRGCQVSSLKFSKLLEKMLILLTLLRVFPCDLED